MAKKLTTNAEIDAFITKVIGEANHHAPSVNAVIYPLSQAVRAHLNLSVDEVLVYERNGKLARTCWVMVGGSKYVFSYNYKQKKIDLRVTSTKGRVIYQFDNNTATSAILAQAAAL
jgi:Integron cassette protein VCH_CASS1 chain